MDFWIEDVLKDLKSLEIMSFCHVMAVEFQ